MHGILKAKMISETKNRILSAARDQFYHYGVKRITMDDIARTTGMSKKTIYQEYADKNALLIDLITCDLSNHTQQIQLIEKSSLNAVDEIVQTMKFMSETFSHINPVMFYDLQRYYGEAWKHYENFKSQCVADTVHKNLLRGIQEEYYRSDINVKILTQLRVLEMDLALNPEFYQQHKFDFIKVQLELIRHFLYGIATLKGHKLITKMLSIKEKD